VQHDNAIQYKRQFMKAGRQLIANLRFNKTSDDGTSFLDFTNSFYRNGVVDSVSSASQQKINETGSENWVERLLMPSL
jgi:hypothetical protein